MPLKGRKDGASGVHMSRDACCGVVWSREHLLPALLSSCRTEAGTETRSGPRRCLTVLYYVEVAEAGQGEAARCQTPPAAHGSSALSTLPFSSHTNDTHTHIQTRTHTLYAHSWGRLVGVGEAAGEWCSQRCSRHTHTHTHTHHFKVIALRLSHPSGR